MKTFFCVFSSILFSVFVLGCGMQDKTKVETKVETKTETTSVESIGGIKNKLALSLPRDLTKINKTKMSPILDENFEREYNFKKKDQDGDMFVRVLRQKPHIFKSPTKHIDDIGWTIQHLYLGEVGDFKNINGEEWVYLKAYLTNKPQSRKGLDKKVKILYNGWIKNENDIKVDTHFCTYYRFNDGANSLANNIVDSGDEPKYHKSSISLPSFITSKCRHIYTTIDDYVSCMSYYLDIDSLQEDNNKIYFDVVWFKTFRGEISPVCTVIINDKNVEGFAYISKYEYDPETLDLRTLEFITCDEQGKVIDKMKLGYDSYHVSTKPFIYRDDKGIFYEYSAVTPEYTRKPNFIRTAIVKVLEGE